MTSFSQQKLASFFKEACLAEITALKPGNVHIFADGHGMVVQDFIKSAEAASKVIAQPGMSVGHRINAAVNATWQTVGCNTNLGIVLLAAPLIEAAYVNPQNIRIGLAEVLSTLTIDDAVLAYQAIQQASPAGMGEIAEQDVSKLPRVTLLQAMQQAQAWDLIARQYADGYQAIFETTLPAYIEIQNRWERSAWAVSALYLKILSTYPDTHIARKYGSAKAADVQQEAGEHLKLFLELDNPKFYQKPLMEFDRSLKARGLNPGTSADMTVATLLTYALMVSA